VSVTDIGASGTKWPDFRVAALQQGFNSVHTTPMKLRGQVIGTMNLFNVAFGAMAQRDAAVVQALTDVATIGVLQERIATESQLIADQLKNALDSRVLIEQAKGVLAQALGYSMEEAFGALRTFARDRNQNLRSVALAVTTLELSPSEIVAETSRSRRPR
jgi:hypothetical protein